MNEHTTPPLSLDIKPVDRDFYAQHIRDWLPRRVIDIHTHVWRSAHMRKPDPGAPSRSVSWPARVADENPVEHLTETYRRLLPDHAVTPLIFTNVADFDQLDAANAYVSASAKAADVPALLFSHPSWSGKETVRRLRAGDFLGLKSYLSYAPAYLPVGEIRIYDFFPHEQLAAMNELGAIVMLHIPRNARLRDPVNLAQLLEIDDRYPDLQVIVAHVGRAYCDEDVGDAFTRLAQTRHLTFDISANTNASVFEGLIRAVGPRRILFGSDLPILRMRTRRITENGRYVNLVPRGLYGDVSKDPNMREVDGAAAEALTFFLYEEIAAFRRAAEATRLTADDIEAVFHANAAGMLARARTSLSR